MKSTIGILAIWFTMFAAVDKPKAIIHASYLSRTEMGISCANGADPTGTKVGNVVIMSCGNE